jgi:hypothetical protein
MSDAAPIRDRAVILLTGLWCYLRHPWLCFRTFKRSRALPRPAMPISELDKFLWRKIFDHNPLFTLACDKLASKAYAKSLCPELKFAEVLWTGRDPDDIPQHLLTGSVVVKANHGSRWNVMVPDGQVDLTDLRRRAADWMSRQYGRSFGEWGYRNASRSIFVEEMLLKDGKPLQLEFKFHVSCGRTAYVFLELPGEGGTQRLHFDREGLNCDAPRHGDGPALNPPDRFPDMRRIAETLAAPFDFVRCDLYERDGEIFFSELTVYPMSGVGTRNQDLPAKQARNSLWDLRRSWFLTEPQRGWRGRYAAAFRRRLDALAAARHAEPRGTS